MDLWLVALVALIVLLFPCVLNSLFQTGLCGKASGAMGNGKNGDGQETEEEVLEVVGLSSKKRRKAELLQVYEPVISCSYQNPNKQPFTSLPLHRTFYPLISRRGNAVFFAASERVMKKSQLPLEDKSLYFPYLLGFRAFITLRVLIHKLTKDLKEADR